MLWANASILTGRLLIELSGRVGAWIIRYRKQLEVWSSDKLLEGRKKQSIQCFIRVGFELNTSGTVLQRTIQLPTFADDIDIIGRPKQAVYEAFVSLDNAAKKMGLIINEGKSKNKTMDIFPMRLNNYAFVTVKQFKYLGTNTSNSNDMKIEIKSRMANRCFYGLINQLKYKLINTKKI